MNYTQSIQLRPIVMEARQFLGTIESASSVSQWVTDTLIEMEGQWSLSTGDSRSRGGYLELSNGDFVLSLKEFDWVVLYDGYFHVFKEDLFDKLFEVREEP